MPEQTDKEKFEAKLQAMREREEANRREIERRKLLTEDERKAEDKARFEAKLKEMQEQELTRKKPKPEGPDVPQRCRYDEAHNNYYYDEYAHEYRREQRGMER